MSASEVCHPPPAFSDEHSLVASPPQHSRHTGLVEAGGWRERPEVAGNEGHNNEEKEDEGGVCRRRRCSGVRREANGAPASGRAEDSAALASRDDAESPDRHIADDRRHAVDAVLHSSAALVAAAPAAGVFRQKLGDRLAELQLGVLPTRLAALVGATVPAPGADSTGDRIADAADSIAGGPRTLSRRLAGCCQFHRSGVSSSSSSSNCCHCAADDAVSPVELPNADFIAATATRCGGEEHERSDHHYARAVISSAPVTCGERPMSAIVEETTAYVDEGFDDDEGDAAAAATAENRCSEDEDVEEEEDEEAEDDSSSGSLSRRRRRKSSTSDLEKLKRLTARLGLNARRPSYTAWQQQLVASSADAAQQTTQPYSPASFSAAAIAANFAAAMGRPRRSNAPVAEAEEATTSVAWNSAATLAMRGDRGGGGVVVDACDRYDGDGDRDEDANITATSDLMHPAADAAAAAAAMGAIAAATDVRATIARVDQLLRSVKTELIKMQETDQTLAKQFIALRQDVQQMRLQQARLRYEDLIDEAAAQLEVAAALAGGRPGYEELLSDDGMLPPAPPSLLRGRLDSSTSSGIGGCSCDPDTADALAQLASIGITKMNLLERRFSVF